MVEQIHTTFNFESFPLEYEPFSNLEKVYTTPEMDDYLNNLVDQCDQQLGQKLLTIIPVHTLIEVRNELEQRLRHYFD